MFNLNDSMITVVYEVFVKGGGGVNLASPVNVAGGGGAPTPVFFSFSTFSPRFSISDLNGPRNRFNIGLHYEETP